MSEVETPQEETSVSSTPAKKGGMWIVVVAIIVIALGGGVYAYRTGMFKGGAASPSVVVSKDPTSVVATVNGANVIRSELDRKIQQLKAARPAGAQDTTIDDGFELRVLDELVNLKLLRAAAEKKGLTVTDAEVQEKIDGLVKTFGGTEALANQLNAVGLTPEELKENIHNEILIRALVDGETDIKSVTVSDAEIKTRYQQMASSTTGDVPTLEQAHDMVRDGILQEKNAAIIQSYIDLLRKDADIKVLL